MFSCFSCARCKTPPQDEIRSTSSLLHHPSHSSLLNYMNNFDVQGNLTTVLPSRENIGNELIVIDYPCPSELKPHVEGRRKSKKEGTIKCVNDSSIPPVKISFISKRSDNYFIIDKQKNIPKEEKEVDQKLHFYYSKITQYSCTYCKKFYINAYKNKKPIEEKMCIHCNRKITQKKYNEIFSGNGYVKNNEMYFGYNPLVMFFGHDPDFNESNSNMKEGNKIKNANNKSNNNNSYKNKPNNINKKINPKQQNISKKSNTTKSNTDNKNKKKK